MYTKTANLEYRIEKVGIATVDKQIEVFTDAFDIPINRERWIHKHYHNPNAQGGNIFAAYHGEEMVGINAFIPMKYQYRGETFWGMQSCDSAIRKEHQGKGAFTKIISEATEHFRIIGSDFVFGFPNKKSYGAFVKLGWKNSIDMNTYVYALNPRKVFDEILSSYPLLYRVLGYAYMAYQSVKLKRFVALPVQREKDINYTESAIINVKEGGFIEDYGRWKLLKEDCAIFSVYSGRELVLELLVKFEKSKGNDGNSLRKTYILNAKSFCEDRNQLVNAIRSFCKYIKEGKDLVITSTKEDSSFNNALRKTGFVKFNCFSMVVKFLSNNRLSKDISSKKASFEIQPIDYDTVISLY